MPLYPLGLSVQSAFAGVPPVELLVLVQLFVTPLKFSDNNVAAFEEEDRSNAIPGHTSLTDEPAVTEGSGFTETVIA